MNLSAIIAVAGVALRILEETPAMLAAVEAFWRNVTDNAEVPPHVEAAVSAAITTVKEKQAGTLL